MTVSVDISHPWRGDLKIDLIGPTGVVYPLRAANSKDDGDQIEETYPVDGRSSSANGTWTLRVEDVTTGDTGYINGWMLRF